MAPLFCFAACSNHASLVKRVFPTGPGEEGPRSGPLSLLVFYATSKPQKLPKIGLFLESRVEKDMSSSRFSHVGVSLAIINALLKECKPHISLVSKSILRIIIRVMSGTEQELIGAATETFIKFTNVRNPEDVIDSEFALVHAEVIKRLCNQVTKARHAIPKEDIKMKGLKALEAVSETSYFVEGSNLDSTVEIVLFALLKNMDFYDTESNIALIKQSSFIPSTPSMPTPLASLGNPKKDMPPRNELSHIAVRSLVGIIRNSNALSLKTLVGFVFKILDTEKMLTSTTSLFLFPIFISSAETQYHFVVVSSVLERLDTETNLSQKTALVGLLQYFITSEKLAGLTIQELLEIFVDHLHKSTKMNFPPNSIDLADLEKLQVSLTQAIGSLSVFLAYPNQINDIISFLVNRTQFDRPVENLTAEELKYLVYILMGLNAVLQGKDSKSKQHNRHSFVPGTVLFTLFAPLLVIADCKVLELRMGLYNLINCIINTSKLSRKSSEFREFALSLRIGLSTGCLNVHNHPCDLVYFGATLCNILSVNTIEELGILFPMIKYIGKKSSNLSDLQREMLINVYVLVFESMAQQMNMPKLLQHVTKIKHVRTEESKWNENLKFNFENAKSMSRTPFSVKQNFDMKEMDFDLNEIYELILQDCPSDAAYLSQSFQKELHYDVTWQQSDKNGESNTTPTSRLRSIKKNNLSISEENKNSDKLKTITKKIIKVGSLKESKQRCITIHEQTREESQKSIEISAPQVFELLKNITDAYGSIPDGRNSTKEVDSEFARKIIEHDLEFLHNNSFRSGSKTRGKKNANDSKTNNPPASYSVGSEIDQPVLNGRYREPAIFDATS